MDAISRTEITYMLQIRQLRLRPLPLLRWRRGGGRRRGDDGNGKDEDPISGFWPAALRTSRPVSSHIRFTHVRPSLRMP